MWARHMYLPFRNVLPAFAPYTDAIVFDSATEFWSSALAAAGNAFDPLTPALVAFIARTACWPSWRSSRERRSLALAVWACEWLIPGMFGIPPPLASAVTVRAIIAASAASAVNLRRM